MLRFLKGLFSIFTTATLITIFELVFYIFILEPTSKEAINKLLASLGQEIIEHDQYYEELNDDIYNLMNVFIIREKKIVYDSMLTSYILILLEIMVLFLILCYLYLKINRYSRFEDHFSNENSSIKIPVISSALTISLLIPFQILFFYFGKEYSYIGKYGLEEIQGRVIKNLEDNL